MPKALSSGPPSAMYMREPKITMPNIKLKAKMYNAWVDCCMVLVMTLTASAKAGLLKARKILVNRTSLRMTNAPPSELEMREMMPGKMAATSIRLEGKRTKRTKRRRGDSNLMASKLVTSSNSSALSKSSERTAQQVVTLKTYSMMKSSKQQNSTCFMAVQLPGFTWHDGRVLRTKLTEEIMMVARITFEMIWAMWDDSGLSNVT
mmetsp:Transcript_75264/g.189390  ORF Transcript_75264/g.189390 Transcript_75264/m.189390 type:complete len:205 (+) Transcript_75264:371-985(+)